MITAYALHVLQAAQCKINERRRQAMENDSDGVAGGGESGQAQDITSQPGGKAGWQQAGATWGKTRADQRMDAATKD